MRVDAGMELFRHRSRVVEDHEMECPRDGTVMEKVQRAGVVIDRCLKCDGIWFDPDELARVAQDGEVEKRAHGRRRYAPTTLACPRCGASCAEAWIAQVQVDTCSSCRGVWLDGGELQEAKRQVSTERTVSTQGVGFASFLSRL